MGSENKKKDTNKTVLPNQAMLFLRGLIGFYLIYLAYELIRDESRVAPRPVIIICAILFIIAGAVLVVYIIRSWIRGEYIGGKADTSVDEEYEEYEEDFVGEVQEITKLEEKELGSSTED